jgi:glutathione S-transferase
LQWHPFGRIPAIAWGEVKLYETSAICRYIDLVCAGTALVPDTPLEAARMEQWISSINSYYHKPCISHLVSQYVFPKGPGGQPDRQVIEAAMPEIDTAMRQLAEHYQSNTYLAGERMSLADLFVAPILMQMRQTPEGLDVMARYAIIEEKVSRIFARPSFQKAHELYRRHLPAANCLLPAP